MNRLIFLILSINLLMVFSRSNGQVLVTKRDSISFGNDTIVKIVLPVYRGKIHWQKSSDNINWNIITGNTTDTLEIKKDTEAMYRAVITEGTCFPLYSDTVRLVFNLPSVTTGSVTNVTQTTATCGGHVTFDGGALVTDRGICWSTTGLPTTADNTTSNGTGTGEFTGNLTGLSAGTPYFVRAYAINIKGTAYGGKIIFTTTPAITLPEVITSPVTDITQTTATCGGKVTVDGGALVTARGICWNTTGLPTTADNTTRNGTGTGSFPATLTGLIAETPYFLRAYAVNGAGTAYGAQISFTTLKESALTVTDIEGNSYPVVTIGTQKWMRQNLKVKMAPDGRQITSYVYGNNEENAKIYGRLYTWDVAMNGSTKEMAQGICPAGWHIPSDGEWKTLEIFLGMTQQEADIANDWRGYGVGTKLKNGGASGYDALYSGRYSGSYALLNQFEYIWTSTEVGDYAWRRCLDENNPKVGRYDSFPKTWGFSIRCLKDK